LPIVTVVLAVLAITVVPLNKLYVTPVVDVAADHANVIDEALVETALQLSPRIGAEQVTAITVKHSTVVNSAVARNATAPPKALTHGVRTRKSLAVSARVDPPNITRALRLSGTFSIPYK
jgi:hypothetical protein